MAGLALAPALRQKAQICDLSDLEIAINLGAAGARIHWAGSQYDHQKAM